MPDYVVAALEVLKTLRDSKPLEAEEQRAYDAAIGILADYLERVA